MIQQSFNEQLIFFVYICLPIKISSTFMFLLFIISFSPLILLLYKILILWFAVPLWYFHPDNSPWNPFSQSIKPRAPASVSLFSVTQFVLPLPSIIKIKKFKKSSPQVCQPPSPLLCKSWTWKDRLVNMIYEIFFQPLTPSVWPQPLLRLCESTLNTHPSLTQTSRTTGSNPRHIFILRNVYVLKRQVIENNWKNHSIFSVLPNILSLKLWKLRQRAKSKWVCCWFQEN